MKRIIILTVGISAQLFAGYIEKPAKLEDFDIQLYGAAAFGQSSADDLESIALGHHDPSREGGTLQGLEAELSWKPSDHFSAFAIYNLSYGAEKELEYEWEEAFVTITPLPSTFSARAGKFFNRFGLQNHVHLHGWDFVDLPISSALFLGDDGMMTEGVDFTWQKSFDQWTFVVNTAYGKASSHEHDEEHAHDDEEHEHDEEEHEHDEEEHEHDEEEHEHDEEEHEHGEFEEAFFAKQSGMIRLEGRYAVNDFHEHQFVSSLAWGENGFEGDTTLMALSYQYQWRENGFESGGRAFRWRTEFLYRWVDAAEEFTNTIDHWSGYTEGVYTMNEHWDAGLRLAHVSESETIELSSRTRVSPVLTWYPQKDRNLSLRLQYNYDEFDSTSEHSVWLQVRFGFDLF